MIISTASNTTPLAAARLGLEARGLEAGNGAGFVVFTSVAGDADGANDAAALETAAADALTLDALPPVGAGGELVPAGDQIKRGGNFIDTIERPDYVTAEASMDRLKLADDGCNDESGRSCR